MGNGKLTRALRFVLHFFVAAILMCVYADRQARRSLRATAEQRLLCRNVNNDRDADGHVH